MNDSVPTIYRERVVNAERQASLISQGVSPVMARLLASRGVGDRAEIEERAVLLLPPDKLKGAMQAGELLANAIDNGDRICIVADYDCDGATACSVMIRGLKMLGAKDGAVDFVVPDRAVHGYGLTPPIVDLAMEHSPDVLVTVDNGIASMEGVSYAKEKGLKVLVTDHHLPAVDDAGTTLIPCADVVVNPSQPGCEFQSKSLCGCGVAFYVISAARMVLRSRGRYDGGEEPNVAGLLDLVALGTVADVVRLDDNNRRLVAMGLKRMRVGKASAGINALFKVAGIEMLKATSTDMGFRLGPRINAAGRMADMRVGIRCLVTDDPEEAMLLAAQLHEINNQRKAVEADMTEVAQQALDALEMDEVGSSIVVYDESFHEGVIGIVAGRLKEAYHRPTFVFAPSHNGVAKGSGRSIPDMHLRDILDLVSKRKPGLLLRFGGHAMAAGATVEAARVCEFQEAFELVCEALMSPETKQRVVLHDGPLGVGRYTTAVTDELAQAVWGQGFEAPLFVDDVIVLEQRIVGEKHLKLKLLVDGERREGIWFGRIDMLDRQTKLAYSLDINEWRGERKVQMLVRGEVVDQAIGDGQQARQEHAAVN
jgi:single-stranded-DNA-specific exonuclease